MSKVKICVNTQTPVMKFSLPDDKIQGNSDQHLAPVVLGELVEGRDFQFTPGGVTRMVLPLLERMISAKIIDDAHWVSLNPKGPREVKMDGITLHNILLESDRLKGYGDTKEAMWRTLHGLPTGPEPPSQIFWKDEFSDFTYYNRISAERIMQMDKIFDFDLFYIHDFQQLPVGHMLNTLKPKIFRWHIPFDESAIPSEWAEFLTTYLNSYDSIIMSCKRYMRALEKFGYIGKSHYVYPYIDPSQYGEPTENEVADLQRWTGISDGDRVVLVVARLDPMKGQDRAIKAMAMVVKDIPNAKLVLVGNGSFSSSKQGIGLSKADRWLEELRQLSRRLGIEEHVIFAGHLEQAQLNAAYKRADLTVLPSVKEGFGLVVIESWLYKKPTIITTTAGIAELIENGHNGVLFDPEDTEGLAGKVSEILLNPLYAEKLGKNGFFTSRGCLIDRGVKDESEIMLGLI